jgi:hypothetical protein
MLKDVASLPSDIYLERPLHRYPDMESLCWRPSIFPRDFQKKTIPKNSAKKRSTRRPAELCTETVEVAKITEMINLQI